MVPPNGRKGIVSNQAEPLTDEERYLVAGWLRRPRNAYEFLFEHVIFYAPSLIFAVYAFLKADLIAVFFAYMTLVIFIIWQQGSQMKVRGTFYSIIKKYEAKAGLLRDTDSEVN